MRTTVTLDADTEQMLRRRMREQKVSFKQALNDAIREANARIPATAFRTPTSSMGRPTLDLDRALQVATELEDDARIARLRGRS